MIELTEAALLDLAGIDNATAAMWGNEQAERYLTFLDGVFLYIDENPEAGATVDQHSDLRSYVARFSKRRSSHGHRIVYRIVPTGIRIIRLLHTSMNWRAHI